MRVRAAQPGEGRAIAGLWRELWDAHEAWGGYAASRDPRVYAQLAGRLEEDARVRAGQAVLGRHVHLIASRSGVVAGQVEGWFERHGTDPTTPHTCEVRRSGTGQALLETLARTAHRLGHGTGVVLAAEVLEPNPAHSFYARMGYAPVAWSARIGSDAESVPVASSGAGRPFRARIAGPGDALAVHHKLRCMGCTVRRARCARPRRLPSGRSTPPSFRAGAPSSVVSRSTLRPSLTRSWRPSSPWAAVSPPSVAPPVWS